MQDIEIQNQDSTHLITPQNSHQHHAKMPSRLPKGRLLTTSSLAPLDQNLLNYLRRYARSSRPAAGSSLPSRP